MFSIWTAILRINEQTLCTKYIFRSSLYFVTLTLFDISFFFIFNSIKSGISQIYNIKQICVLFTNAKIIDQNKKNREKTCQEIVNYSLFAEQNTFIKIQLKLSPESTWVTSFWLQNYQLNLSIISNTNWCYSIFTKTEIILVSKFNKLYPTLIIID